MTVNNPEGKGHRAAWEAFCDCRIAQGCLNNLCWRMMCTEHERHGTQAMMTVQIYKSFLEGDAQNERRIQDNTEVLGSSV